ncbi:hypothetical protein RIEGSTA812A_PEG_321 [invertebrate metagenome]|uniref:Uncharacterized protein n=1 Tax=invertebrate metagenome TaxID=1711999 RepID=A0A484H9K8_9ZZZZ
MLYHYRDSLPCTPYGLECGVIHELRLGTEEEDCSVERRVL